jgi:hypothetical protein
MDFDTRQREAPFSDILSFGLPLLSFPYPFLSVSIRLTAEAVEQKWQRWQRLKQRRQKQKR